MGAVSRVERTYKAAGGGGLGPESLGFGSRSFAHKLTVKKVWKFAQFELRARVSGTKALFQILGHPPYKFEVGVALEPSTPPRAV